MARNCDLGLILVPDVTELVNRQLADSAVSQPSLSPVQPYGVLCPVNLELSLRGSDSPSVRLAEIYRQYSCKFLCASCACSTAEVSLREC